MPVCIDVMVLSSACEVSCNGAGGCGMSDVHIYIYMLESVVERTQPWGTPVMN